MPIISQFYGITIRMFYGDHPPPHFHAIYGEFELIVGISPVKIMKGKGPMRVRSLILEWAAMHQEELLENWENCQNGKEPEPIIPLE